MNPIALAAAAIILAQRAAAPPAAGPAQAAVNGSVQPAKRLQLAAVLNTPEARDALARVAWAEAGNQGESGLAAVVYTIINRLNDGRWGATVEQVVDAPHQFEPVMRAGGSWRRLPPVSPVQEAVVHTIVGLALQGRLPDLTGGARYFQNEAIVAARAAPGQAPQSLVGFGGLTPSARIGAHTFYAGAPPHGRGARRRSRPRAVDPIFFGGEGAQPSGAPDPLAPASASDR